MSLLLVENAEVLVTMDSDRREIENGAVLIRDNRIEWVGSGTELLARLEANAMQPDRRIDASGCIVIPGLVNCHHHLYQTLTRSIGTAEGKSLFDWLQTLYPIWGQMDAEAVYVSARLGLAELMLSGATTVADHLCRRTACAKTRPIFLPIASVLSESFTIPNPCRCCASDLRHAHPSASLPI